MYPSARGTYSVLELDIPQDTDVSVIQPALQSILDAESPRFIYEANISIYHTGEVSGGGSPSTATVSLIQPGDDPTLAVLRFNDGDDQDSPAIASNVPLPCSLVFRTPDVGGARIRVQVRVNFVGTAFASQQG